MFTMPIILTLAGYFTFSAAVDAMLPPAPGQERTFYGFLYRFLNRLAANATKLAEARFGGLAGNQPAGANGGGIATATHERDTITVVAPGATGRQ
jgi:hypothetical protein